MNKRTIIPIFLIVLFSGCQEKLECEVGYKEIRVKANEGVKIEKGDIMTQIAYDQTKIHDAIPFKDSILVCIDENSNLFESSVINIWDGEEVRCICWFYPQWQTSNKYLNGMCRNLEAEFRFSSPSELEKKLDEMEPSKKLEYMMKKIDSLQEEMKPLLDTIECIEKNFIKK